MLIKAMPLVQQNRYGKRSNVAWPSFSIQLAKGRADLYPEMLVKTFGFKEIDLADWIINRVTHTLNDSGFTSALELEVKLPN